MKSLDDDADGGIGDRIWDGAREVERHRGASSAPPQCHRGDVDAPPKGPRPHPLRNTTTQNETGKELGARLQRYAPPPKNQMRQIWYSASIKTKRGWERDEGQLFGVFIIILPWPRFLGGNGGILRPPHLTATKSL